MKSPYKDLPKEQWETKTKELINSHPLKNDIVDIVMSSWNAIFESNLAGFKIGKDIYPEPQIMGFFLHCLIALHINKKYPDYKLGSAKTEKDIEIRPMTEEEYIGNGHMFYFSPEIVEKCAKKRVEKYSKINSNQDEDESEQEIS